MRPLASRFASRFLSVFLVMPLTRESTWEAGNTSVPVALLVVGLFVPMPVPQAAAPTATVVAASEASRVLRDRVLRRKVISVLLSARGWGCGVLRVLRTFT